MTIDIFHDQSPRKYWERTHDPWICNQTTNCATGPGNFAVPILLKWALNQIMVLLSCYNSVLALFDCCGAILYEFLITGFMDPVYI